MAKRGRPATICLDSLKEDVGLDMEDLKMAMVDRGIWRKIAEATNIQPHMRRRIMLMKALLHWMITFLYNIKLHIQINLTTTYYHSCRESTFTLVLTTIISSSSYVFMTTSPEDYYTIKLLEKMN